MKSFLSQLGIRLPILAAPMAGVGTPALAAAVSNAGGLGAIAVGACDAVAARDLIRATRQLTAAPFNVNFFCHQPPQPDPAREASWCAALAPSFAALSARPPATLVAPYRSFLQDAALLEMVLEERPAVVSFHFGLPPAAAIGQLRQAGVTVLATATHPHEGAAAVAAGVQAVVAQGIEAGGHRGVFDPRALDETLGTLALTRLLVRQLDIPVIAAGGIMDGAGVAAALRLGACAAQLGTAFVVCPEAATGESYRAALMGPGAQHTVMTPVFSGRPARSLVNRFTALRLDPSAVPDYPIAYHAGKALAAAGMAAGDAGFVAQWAGQGAPLVRALPAGELVNVLADEMV